MSADQINFTVDGYTLTRNSAGTSSSSNISLGDNPIINVANNCTATIDTNLNSVAGGTFTIGSGTSATYGSSGTLVLNWGNQFVAAMNIENGKVLAENDSAFGDSGKTNSYTVTCQASKDGNPQIELSGNITIPSYISFSVANSSGVIVNLSGTNTISGDIRPIGGGDTTIVSNSGTLILNTITPYANGRSIYIEGSGNGVINGAIVNGSTTNLPVTMNGTGTWTLAGANTYTGATTITSGVLQFANTGAMPVSSTVTVKNGATLAVNAGGAGEFTNATTSVNGSIGGLLAGVGGQGRP